MQYFSDFFQDLSANFLHGFAVRVDDDIGGGFIFGPAVVHETAYEGDVLVVLEAMKMENEIKAGHDAVVASVAVSKGESVDTGAVLVTLN